MATTTARGWYNDQSWKILYVSFFFHLIALLTDRIQSPHSGSQDLMG